MDTEQLKKKWLSENTAISQPATNKQIDLFEAEREILIPKDLRNYFATLNGTNGEYDGRLYNFCSLNQFKSIDEELKNWGGLPNYSNIINTLESYSKYYVFADYMFHLFSYAIRLEKNESFENEILVVCGDEYKKIAASFSEFIDLYLEESIKLQF